MGLRFFCISWPKPHRPHIRAICIAMFCEGFLFSCSTAVVPWNDLFHRTKSIAQQTVLQTDKETNWRGRKNNNNTSHQSGLNKILTLKAMAVSSKRGNKGNVCCLNPQIMIQTNETLLPNKLARGHSHAQTRRNWFGFCWYAMGMCSMTLCTVYICRVYIAEVTRYLIFNLVLIYVRRNFRYKFNTHKQVQWH